MTDDNRKISKSELLERYVNQPVAILCMRYWYRGVVSEVGLDFVTLSNARAVEQTGRASGNRPETEDPIPSDVHISLDVIELVGQPAWVWHELGDKNLARPNKEKKTK